MQLDFLAPVGWTLLLNLAAYGAGRPLLRAWTRRTAPDLDGLLSAFLASLLGIVALSQVALLLGLAGLLHHELLITIAVLLALAGAVFVLQGTRPRLKPGWGHVPLAMACAFALVQLPAALYPGLEFDDNVYHLFLPKLYLAHHSLVPRPHLLFANMPHLTEVLYAFPMAIGDFTAAKVWNYSTTFWVLAGLASFARRHLGPFGPGLAAWLYLGGVDVQYHFGNAHVEPLLALFLLGSVLAFEAWMRRREVGLLWIAGIACGAACATKYTAWLFTLGIVPPMAAAILLAHGADGLPRRRVRDLLALTVPPTLLVAPWLLRAWIVAGNPIYPNLYGLFGGRYWSGIQHVQYLRALAAAGGLDWSDPLRAGQASGGAGVLELLESPLRLMFEWGFFYSLPFSIGLVALGLLAIFLPTTYRAGKGLLVVMAALCYLVWFFSFQQGRYLVTVVPVFALVACLGLVPLRNAPRALGSVAGILMALAAGQVAIQTPWMIDRIGLFAEVFTKPRRKLLEANTNYHLCRYLDRVVPQQGRVLCLWDNRFFFLELPFLADSLFEAPTVLAWLRRLDDPDAFAAELRQEGFTHAVLDPATLALYATDSFPTSRVVDPATYPAEAHRNDLELLQRFFDEHLEEIGRWQDHIVFRLRETAEVGD